MVTRFNTEDPLTSLEAVVSPDELIEMQDLVPGVRLEPSVEEYLINVVRATRDHAALDLGASPRATLALHRATQALAAQQGRDYVLPDDVKYLAPYVLGHRFILTAQARLRGQSVESVVDEILRAIPVPITGPSAIETVAEESASS